jgi:hypothetical protein
VIGVAGLLSFAAGAAVAYLANRFPTHVAALETCAGIMLIGGLALAGCALPVIL